MGLTLQPALAKALDTWGEYQAKECRGGLQVWVDYAAEMLQTWPTPGVEENNLVENLQGPGIRKYMRPPSHKTSLW